MMDKILSKQYEYAKTELNKALENNICKIIWMKLTKEQAQYLVEKLQESIKSGAIEINIPIDIKLLESSK